METWTIVGYLTLAALLLVPAGYAIAWGISVIRTPRLPPMPALDTESWQNRGRPLTMTYRKGNRPDQGLIDDITRDIERYEELVVDYINRTGEYIQEFKDGISLTGISFPICDDEQDQYDFSIDYTAEDGSDMFLTAYMKDGKVQSLSAGD